MDLCGEAMAGVSSHCFDPVPFNEPNIRKEVEPRIGVFVLGPLAGTVIRAKHVGCAKRDLRETLLSQVLTSFAGWYMVWSYCETVEMAETLQELLQTKYLGKPQDASGRSADKVASR